MPREGSFARREIQETESPSAGDRFCPVWANGALIPVSGKTGRASRMAVTKGLPSLVSSCALGWRFYARADVPQPLRPAGGRQTIELNISLISLVKIFTS